MIISQGETQNLRDFKLKVQGKLIGDHLTVASVFNIVPIAATGQVFELVDKAPKVEMLSNLTPCLLNHIKIF